MPHILKKNSPFIDACTANTPDALEQVQRLTGKPTYILPYLFPEPPERHTPIPFDKILSGNLPVEIAFVSRLERIQKRAHWLPEIIRHLERAGDKCELAYLRRWTRSTQSTTTPRALAQRDFLWMGRPLLDLRETTPARSPLLLFPLGRIAHLHGRGNAVRPCLRRSRYSSRHPLDTSAGRRMAFIRRTQPRACAEALLIALKDTKLIVQKRQEAYALASQLFKPSLAEEAYLNLEAQFQNVRFNGQFLRIDNAPKFRAVTLKTFLKRAVASRMPF